MSIKEIKPQYTIDTFIEMLRQRIDMIEKWNIQQGLLPEIREKSKVSALATIEQTVGLSDLERMWKLARMLADNIRFCQSDADIYNTAKRTVKQYCC